MTGHARLSPSNLRWPKCPGSIREEASYPDVAGEAAIDGTGSHLLLEIALTEGKSAYDYVGTTIGEGDEERPLGWFVDEDRAARVQMGIDYVARRYSELTAQYPEEQGYSVSYQAETKSYPGTAVSPAIDDWWGTTDITFEVEDTEGSLVYLEICDYKDGRMRVDCNDNTQLLSYAIGKAVRKRRSDYLTRMSIVQPRTNPPVRYTDDYTAVQMAKELTTLVAAARATEYKHAKVIAGDHCTWCKANPKRGGHCTAPLEKVMRNDMENTEVIATDNAPQQAASLYDQLLKAVANVTEISGGTLAKLLEAEKELNDAFKVLKEEATTRLEQGLPVPGWAMLPGNASRTWVNDEQAVKAMRRAKLKQDEYAPRKMLSPAQAEKLVGKKLYEEKVASAVTEVAGKPTLKRGKAKEEKSADLFGAIQAQEEPAAAAASEPFSFI